MRAVVISQPGGPEVLTLKQVDDPEPGRGEVLVNVKAVGVNRADILQRMGHYPSPPDSPPDIPGLEFAGVVEAIGPGVSGFLVNDKVFGLAGGGTYADFVVVPARCLSHMPVNLSFVEAAAVPEGFICAYDAMICQCGLAFGESVLIHAIGSGVGVAALQIARLFGGVVIGTSRHEEKIEAARKLGLEHSIVVRDKLFAEQVKDMTGGCGVNLVMELVGGSYVAQDVLCAAVKGRIMVVGLMGGLASEIDFAHVLKNRLQIRGTTLRARPLEEKILAGQLLQNHLVPLFEKNLLKPVIDKVFPLSAAGEAHDLMGRNRNFGKIVLEVSK
jgi:NADPH:quinone reductase